MRVRTLATALTVSFALVTVAATPASASGTTPLVFTDQAGDANAANDQGLGLGLDGTPTPVALPGFDIRSVTLDTDEAGVDATTLIVTLELDTFPRAGLFRVQSDVDGTCFWTEATFNPSGALNDASVRVCDDSTTGYTYYPVGYSVTDTSIVWSVPLEWFASEGLVPGATMTNLEADARMWAVAVTVPSVDRASTSSTYTIGQ